LHNKELHDLYSSPSILIIIKSRTRWAGHVARVGEKTNVYSLLRLEVFMAVTMKNVVF
jgi:hypothetical protein